MVLESSRSSRSSSPATSSSTNRSSGSRRSIKLAAYRYHGNWVGIDTFKDRQEMEDLWANGDAWWAIWRNGNATGPIARACADPASLTIGVGES